MGTKTRPDTPVASQARQIAEHIDELPDLIKAIADANTRPPIADVRVKLDYARIEFECLPVGDFIEKHWTPDHAEKFMARVANVSNALQSFIATITHLSAKPSEWLDRKTLAEFMAVARLTATTIRSWADEIEKLEAATLLTDRATKRRRISRQELRTKAESYVRRNGYSGLKSLARSLGCNPSSLHNAIKASRFLKDRKAKYEVSHKARVRETPLTDVHLENIPQQTEAHPDEALSELIDEQAAVMQAEERQARVRRPPSRS